LAITIIAFALTDSRRVEDEAALRVKVDEALNVYDEYIKTKAASEAAEAGEVGKGGEQAEEKA
jgi:polyadenylate-binding protein